MQGYYGNFKFSNGQLCGLQSSRMWPRQVRRSVTKCRLVFWRWTRKTLRNFHIYLPRYTASRPTGWPLHTHAGLLQFRLFARPAKMGHGPPSSKIFVLFYILFVCKCVQYYYHRVATQLQLTNTSYHIILYPIISKYRTAEIATRHLSHT